MISSSPTGSGSTLNVASGRYAPAAGESPSPNVSLTTVTSHVDVLPDAMDVGTHDCVSDTPPCWAMNAIGRCWIGAELNSGSSSICPKYCVGVAVTAVTFTVMSAVWPERTTTNRGLTRIVVPSGALAEVT